jgi:anti-sigma factor RsiW
MGRPSGEHIDEQELSALVPSCSESGQGAPDILPTDIRRAERHLASCADCRRKVSQYRQLVQRSKVNLSEATTPHADCPTDIDWHEVAAGLWPELKARQAITHAARCGYCGPRLRAAVPANDDPTPQEDAFLAELRVPFRPPLKGRREPAPANQVWPPIWRQFLEWKVLIPAGALLVFAGLLITNRSSSSAPLSGRELARFAVSTHKQHVQGKLDLDVRSDSPSLLNEWLNANSPFSVALPVSPDAPGEERPYRVEGARLVQIGAKTAAYIVYQIETGPVGLLVTPVSVAVASGGIQVDFKKVSFHYSMIAGYKVVTWSVHGLTYALISQEGNTTQRSCMVCHAAMGDRDLSHTPVPFEKNVAEPVWQ